MRSAVQVIETNMRPQIGADTGGDGFAQQYVALVLFVVECPMRGQHFARVSTIHVYHV